MSASAAVDPSAPIVPILFPMEQRISWVDTFGAARSGGRTHAGNDLMAAKMTPLLAVVDGTVDWLNLTGKLSSYNNLPSYSILLHGVDGNDYFYVHINNDTPGTDDGKGGVQFAYAPGLTNGTHVKRGDLIGYVGDSGNAEDTAPHLHFEIHVGGYVSASGTQTRSPSAIDPYNSLKAAPTLAEWTAAGQTTYHYAHHPGGLDHDHGEALLDHHHVQAVRDHNDNDQAPHDYHDDPTTNPTTNSTTFRTTTTAVPRPPPPPWRGRACPVSPTSAPPTGSTVTSLRLLRRRSSSPIPTAASGRTRWCRGPVRRLPGTHNGPGRTGLAG